jgi:hypothetical protein
MAKKSKDSSSDVLKTVLGIAAILIVFILILRAALDPLYQEVGQLESRQNQPMPVNQTSSQQNGNGGGNNGGGSGGGGNGGENVNVNLGGLGGLFNWALGWAWGGPGWYSGPNYGWWGANVWNGWRNRWNGGGWDGNNWNGNNWNGRGWNGGNNRVWGGTVNENNTREFNDVRSNDYNRTENNVRREDSRPAGICVTSP